MPARYNFRGLLCPHQRLLALAVLVAGLFPGTTSAHGEPAVAAGNLRFEENWQRQTPVSVQQIGQQAYALKNLRLQSSPSITLSTGLQERLRLEVWENFQFARPDNNDDVLLLQRLKAHADVHIGESLRVFVEAKSALAFDRDLPGGRRISDVDTLALQNGFIEFELPFLPLQAASLRLGRQEILFDRQRLLSPADWSNSRRSFDGFRFDAGHERQKLSAFWLRPVLVRKYDSNISDDSSLLYGLYYQHEDAAPPLSVHAYFLARHKDLALPLVGTQAKDKRYTAGARLLSSNKGSPWQVDIEGAYQFGSRADYDISAWMLSTELHYSWQSHRLKPVIWLALDLASGQSNASGDITLFDPLFPTGHAHLGYIDLIGRFNIIDYRLGVRASASKDLSLSLEAHHFNRFDRNDGVYSPAGTRFIGGGLSSKREIGSELDALANYRISPHWRAQMGYSVFFAGDFIADTGEDAAVHFFHFTVQYTY